MTLNTALLPVESGLNVSTADVQFANTVDPTSYITRDGGARQLSFIVDGVTCPGCVSRIEDELARVPHLDSARLNLTLKRLTVSWTDPQFDPRIVCATLERLGYRATPFDPIALSQANEDSSKQLVKALAVAGFAAANIMLLSVSIWSGDVTDMGPGTRDFLHWISALIALPTVAYAGQPFFSSAWNALRTGRVNMDVPISLGVLLATCASVMETLRSAEHAYFDAAVMLLFFLLVGRYLDQRMRAHVSSVAANLLALKAVAATVLRPDGTRTAMPAALLKPGMVVVVAPGDRIPADGVIVTGRSDIDASLITGESLPAVHGPGDAVYAGTLSQSGSLEISVTKSDDDTLLGRIVELMENASQSRARTTRIADRAARFYAPSVHALAAMTFLAWFIFGTGGWHSALMAAIAVLIITCPCAIGLAVPAVQAVTTGRLLRAGVLLKSADALERLAEIDTVVLDKTGTLTSGRPELSSREGTPDDLALARRLAVASRHPLCAAITRASTKPVAALPVEEHPGFGLQASLHGEVVRLGNRIWCDVPQDRVGTLGESELWLKRGKAPPVRFGFKDQLRSDAAEFIHNLRADGLKVKIISGDRADAVAEACQVLGVPDSDVNAAAQPQDKISLLQSLAAEGRKVLMIGDGLNDAPALACAHVSMSPAAASDVSQTAADFLFLGEKLAPVLAAVAGARDARARIIQNFAMAIAYNVLAVPLAMAGVLTPLIAAAAMSGSSIVVVLNALRPGRRWSRA